MRTNSVMNYYMHVTNADENSTNEGNFIKNDTMERIKSMNSMLSTELMTWKNKINNDPSWDQYKKLTNEYEFIITNVGVLEPDMMTKYPPSNPLSWQGRKKPLSRSYFKLWEILHDFDLLSPNTTPNKTPNRTPYNTPYPDPIVSAHLAEGHGGFIEALCDFIKKYHIIDNYKKIYGLTLLSMDKTIPNWKIGSSMLREFPISLNTIDSNNGNLYNIHTIDTFIDMMQPNKCTLVTADGGFDFSKDFNNQEMSFYMLLMCEIYTTLCIQRPNGSFLLKVFDLFLEETIKLIACCKLFYDDMYIIKPNTSRPANSEKYIIFRNFTKDLSPEQISVKAALRRKIISKDPTLDIVPRQSVLQTVMNSITTYNAYYTIRQISYIKKTLDLGDLRKTNDTEYKHMVHHLTTDNAQCCEIWCRTYHLTN